MPESNPAPTAITPYPLSMVLCDSIWQDPGTRKYYLLGTFTEIVTPACPAIHPQLAILVEITDGRGTMQAEVSCSDADEEREIFRIEGELKFEDPRAIIQLAFNLQGVVFPEPGEYRIKLTVNKEFLIERRILVRLLERRNDDASGNT